MDVAEWNQDIGEVRAVSEDRRKAIVDLLQGREALQARIRELERFIETGDQS
jgi:signal transduction histidine kinase